MTDREAESEFNDHIHAIGNVVVTFQSLETVLRQGLNVLFRPSWPQIFHENPIEKLASVALAQASFGGLCQIAGAVPSIFTPETIRHDPKKGRLLASMLSEGKIALEVGLKWAHQVEQRRNQLVHSHWFATDLLQVEDGSILRAKVQRSGDIRSHTEDVESLRGAAKDAENAIEMVLRGLDFYKNALLFGWRSLHG